MIIETLVTPSLNELKGKWSMLNWKKKYLGVLRNFHLDPFALREPPKTKRHVTVVRMSTRLLDDDNLHGGVKPLIDAIKENRLIWDDSPKYIILDVTQTVIPKGVRKTLVSIRDTEVPVG